MWSERLLLRISLACLDMAVNLRDFRGQLESRRGQHNLLIEMQNAEAHSLRIFALADFLVAEAYSAEDAISLTAVHCAGS